MISCQGIHDRYGGVVPEVASRHHLELTNAVVEDALARADATLDDVELVAVTRGPGLVGALLVGVASAKALAAARRLPLAAVDHLQGHVAANFLGDAPFEPPFLCLVASGGHTFLARVTEHDGFEVLGQTLDDAAGEAFDKGARLLGLPLPGRPAPRAAGGGGRPRGVRFPDRGRRGRAGLLLQRAEDRAALPAARPRGGRPTAAAADLAASYQRAIVEALVRRIEQAVEQTGLRRVALGGGVAANGPLRAACRGARSRRGRTFRARELCTDNAAMIAGAARFTGHLAFPDYLTLDAYADPAVSRLVLYGRDGCHLCDEARAVLVRIGHPFEEVDIEADPELHRPLLGAHPGSCARRGGPLRLLRRRIRPAGCE